MDKVYFISDGKNVKIGFTKSSVFKRVKQLSTGSATKLYVLGYIRGTKALEKELHIKFGNERLNLEWFKATDELLRYINDNNLLDVSIQWYNGRLIPYKKISMAD